MSKRIHIVSFDVPYPADYGGVIDVFSRVKWFSENGFQVILHCFIYKRPEAKALEQYAEVHYYERPLGLKHGLSKTPFIVKTRMHSKLEKILSETTDDVILEGLHCAYYLNLQPGKFYLRTHNIEHEYYAKLAKGATFLKRLFFLSEAKKLRKYEAVLAKAKGLLVISEKELPHFSKLNSNSIFVPPVFEKAPDYQATAPFVLFHGNLSVEENEVAALWILDQIVPHKLDISFVIAGKNPSDYLRERCDQQNVELVSNPSNEKLFEWMKTARIHLLYTTNSAGLKLKFIHAMQSSGHVICNTEMAAGSGLTAGYHGFESAEEAINKINALKDMELSVAQWKDRMNLVDSLSGSKKLIQLFVKT